MGSAASRSTNGELFVRRAVEGYFLRWPFYLALFAACLLIGYLGVRDVGQLYTSTGSFFVESRALINEQSSDDFERVRLAPSGFASQDLRGLMSTDPFMTTMAEASGHEVSELRPQRNQLFRILRRSTEVRTLSDNLVQIAVTTNDPEASQAQARALIDTYVQFQISAALAEGMVAEGFFDGEAQAVSEELLAARDAVDRYASRFDSLDSLSSAENLELTQLRDAEALAEVRFRAAVDGAEQARLIQARAETEAAQQFAFINEPALPETPDTTGLDAFYWMLSFVIVGLAINVLPAVVSAMRSSTVLVPEDLAADPRLPVVAVVPRVASSRLSVSTGAGKPTDSPRPAGDMTTDLAHQPSGADGDGASL